MTIKNANTKTLAPGAGWSSPVARQAHNLKVVGSNPTPATKFYIDSIFLVVICHLYINIPRIWAFFFIFYDLTRNFYTIIGTYSFLLERTILYNFFINGSVLYAL